MAAKLDRIAADSTAPEQTDRHFPEVRRAWDFRFGLFPVTALRDAPSMARCCRWTAELRSRLEQAEQVASYGFTRGEFVTRPRF